MSGEIMELGARRAAARNDPKKVSPRDLLLMLIQDIDEGKLNPEHLIVISAASVIKGTYLRLDQCGKYDRFGQIGILTDAVTVFTRD